MKIPLFENAQSLLDAAPGTTLGTSPWLEIEQTRIDRFADATDDHQWIHVDPARARSGPFGATIAHGFLTLALVARFLPQILDVRFRFGTNYGCERVRFPAAVKAGSRVRGRGELIGAELARDGSVQATIRVTVEIEGEAKPACVADVISRYYF
ncbi:MAG: MaoC family dehydratase [Rudaea sp.]|uniref:MaoC family dehydratase n=1 Tax=Rudaea sp. TaxID=2136325 RepID=UPI0039E50AAB